MRNVTGARLASGRLSWHTTRTAILAGLLLTITTPVWAQQRGGEIRTYPLRNCQARDIEPTLARLLPPGAELFVDSRANQFIVHGSAEVQRVAAEAIQNLDRPGARRSEPAVAAETTVKTYTCPPGQKASLAVSLQREFGASQGVRVVPDPRSNQVLVNAPPAVQSQIAQRLGQASARGPRPVMGSFAPARGAEVGGPGEVRLQNSTADQVERLIISTLGKRLEVVDRSSADRTVYQLMDREGAPVRMTIDRHLNRITVDGTGRAADALLRFVRACDGSRSSATSTVRVVPVEKTDMADVRKLVDAIPSDDTPAAGRPDGTAVRRPDNTLLASQLLQQEGQPAAEPAAEPGVPVGPPAELVDGQPAGPPLTAEPDLAGGLVGNVQIVVIDEFGTLVITGEDADVQRVLRLIQQIEDMAVETAPTIAVRPLAHVDCESLAELIAQVYEDVFALRQGTVSITALVKPNSLLVIGRQDAVDTVLDLVRRLDRPVPPESQFRVFRLKRANAATTLETLETLYDDERSGLGTKILLTDDYRTNSLIVQASPGDLAEIAELIKNLDAGHPEAMNDFRVIKLDNSMADDLADVLNDAIVGEGGGQEGDQRAGALRLIIRGAAGQQSVESGILADVRIVADIRSNSLLISAPEDSMSLIEALIRELDQLPAVEAQIKVFTIVNSDALALVDMLETLFGASTAQSGQPAVRTGAMEGESSLVSMRFATDVRSNSIIATGTVGDLQVVEAILMRLDESDVREQKVEVVRLNNAYAPDVADAINEYLDSQRQVESIEPGLLSAFEQIEREVIVVPELVSNSLLVSATPRYFDEIMDLIEQFDEREPMVMIQVVIAEVELNNTDEFGVEIGLQDSILFDRSLLSILDTTQETTFDSVTGLPVATTETIRSATADPGFGFNTTDPLPNTASDAALATATTVAGQALSNFSVGRLNSELGYGGLILSASSEAVSVLIRALQEKRRMDILSRPQIMTLNNQPAFIQVGERVPTIRGVSENVAGGQTNQIEMENAGIILAVTPRISPDGLVVMEIDAEKSEVGPEAEGIAIAISQGQTIRAPKIKTTTTQTTIAALDGQTVVLGGLIMNTTSSVSRRVPLLSDIPVLGNLFRYDGTICKRTELLIILTPRVVKNEGDAEMIKQVEAERMNWCLTDVIDFTNDQALRPRGSEWTDEEITPFYPEAIPEGALMMPEMAPTPAGSGPLMRPPETPPRQLHSEPMPPEDRTGHRHGPEFNAAAHYGQGPPSAVRPATYDAGLAEAGAYPPVPNRDRRYADQRNNTMQGARAQYNPTRLDTIRPQPAQYDSPRAGEAGYDERRSPSADQPVVPAYQPVAPDYRTAPQKGGGYVEPGQHSAPYSTTGRY